MSPEIVIILVAVVIYAIYIHIYFVVSGVIVIVVFILILKARKSEKNRREEELRQRIYAEECRKREEANKREAKRLAQVAREKEEKFQQAEREGTNVCRDCKTINPKRCLCGKCIEYVKPCYDNCSSYTGDECNKCYWRRKRRECEAAERRGEGVCWDCLTVRPSRCINEGCNVCTDSLCGGDGGGGLCCNCAD